MRAMRSALRDASIHPSRIGYINAHATSTPVGDAIEVDAIEGVFGNCSKEEFEVNKRVSPLFVSSTKGATGHMLGAAGAVEAAFTAMAVSTGILPPTLNLTISNSSPGGEDLIRPSFSHITGQALSIEQNLEYAMSNSFGFGGTNASLIFRKYNIDENK